MSLELCQTTTRAFTQFCYPYSTIYKEIIQDKKVVLRDCGKIGAKDANAAEVVNAQL